MHSSTKFAGLTGESDPLLGNRKGIPGCPVTGNFKMPGDGTLPQARVRRATITKLWQAGHAPPQGAVARNGKVASNRAARYRLTIAQQRIALSR